MAAPKVESSNTRFLVLLGIGAFATIGWITWRSPNSSFALPSMGFEFPWELVIFGTITTLGILGSISKSRRIERQRTERKSTSDPIDTHYQRIEERFLTEQKVDRIGGQRSWNDMTRRERAQVLGGVALVLGFLFFPIGSIIGLAIIRKYKSSDSTMITAARVLLILSLAFAILAFFPIIWFLFNP